MSEEITSLSSVLDDNSQAIVNQVITETDPEKLKDLISLFNLNQSKKNIVRANAYSVLLDKISEQMAERLSKKSGEFSNKDLLDYLAAVRSVIDKADLNSQDFDMKPLIVQNTQVNINTESLDRDSKEKVASVVKSILSSLSNQRNFNGNDDFVEVDDNN